MAKVIANTKWSLLKTENIFAKVKENKKAYVK